MAIDLKWRPRDAREKALLAEFAQWVASNRAYNGAPDPGQALYNEQINAVLPTWAEEFLAEREAERKAQQEKDSKYPHSRACGLHPHLHGTMCHSNCPTCGGRPIYLKEDS